ncbi:MAG: redoxin domain-containing protein [Myxococcales bacterium]|nr:redoxin domain-containing protein [Myxococcales bacterium]USN50197.1 MAG: redoxin domain-containing protein [Myxococcales bacterium]
MQKISLLLLIFLTGCQAAYHVKLDRVRSVELDTPSLALEAADGSFHRLSKLYKKNRGTVLVFWQTACPCVKRYQKRVIDLNERYRVHGIKFLHLSSNTNESFERVKNEYNKRQIPLTLMRDNNAVIAKALGAKGTPTAILIDQRGRVQFMGWIDNERDVGESGRIAYLEDALEQFIGAKPISVPTSPMFGCAIY